MVVLGAQAVAVGELASRGQWLAVGLAVAAGRAAFGWGCAAGVPAASPTGLGSLVAGTQPRWRVVGWTVVLAVATSFAVPDRWWLGPAAVLVACGLAGVVLRHVVRRLGGVTGDVLGALSEVTVTVVLVGCSLR